VYLYLARVGLDEMVPPPVRHAAAAGLLVPALSAAAWMDVRLLRFAAPVRRQMLVAVAALAGGRHGGEWW
jgi:hypothetical protein